MRPLVLSAAFGFISAVAFGNDITKNECIAKGGVGIVSKDFYVVTKSEKNELILPNHERWSGLERTIPQVVYVREGKVVEQPSSVPTFELPKVVLISFQQDRIYFYDFPTSHGGYYLRRSQ